MEQTQFTDLLQILGQLAGGTLLVSDSPGERAIGALISGGSQIPGLLQDRAMLRKQDADRQQALRSVRAELNRPIAVEAQPIPVPIGNG